MEGTIQKEGDLILVRGLPGSGKSTFANVILQQPNNNPQEVLSADDFFVNNEGVYVFDSSKIKEAHNYCQFRCSERMRQGIARIVVANTFTQEWEMDEYFKMAERYNYRVHTVIMENRHGNENVHGVPDDKLQQMKNRFEIKL
jgi:predicted kinase